MQRDSDFSWSNDQKDFRREFIQTFEINADLADKLFNEFDIVPKGQFAPDPDEKFPGTIRDASKEVDLPEHIVGELIQSGVPFTYGGLDFMRLFRKVLEAVDGLNKPITQSLRLFSDPDLNAPWKRWVYQCYMNNKIKYDSQGKMLNPEKRIIVEDMAQDLIERFGLNDTPWLRREILKIREKANNDKKRSREKDIPISEVSAQRQAQYELKLHLGLL